MDKFTIEENKTSSRLAGRFTKHFLKLFLEFTYPLDMLILPLLDRHGSREQD